MDKYLKSALSLIQAETRTGHFTVFPDHPNITYTLFLKLKKGATYDGQVIVNFHLSKVSPNLFFDFSGTTISSIIINEKKLSTQDSYESLRDRRFLQLPESNLLIGKNQVEITFSNLYSNDGLGLHSFTDTDGKQYIYSQCETYAANKIFPCFDQPDLKATLTLTMAVPKDWITIANEPISNQNSQCPNLASFMTAQEEPDYHITSFLTTPKISTYLYVFCAGPFQEIKCTNLYRSIPMSCYCRESLLTYLKDQADEIFEVTREVLRFYESFFSYPYPFSKYDSVFCPEFKFGAMENPGAVTFNDRIIWREKVTVDRNMLRVLVIAHEASHHWFGDLVTMKWWNDLWLNESFADFIAHFCLFKIQEKITVLQLKFQKNGCLS